jgi:hypothetical protein
VASACGRSLAKQAAVMIRASSADSESMRWEPAPKDGRSCLKATVLKTPIAGGGVGRTSHVLAPSNPVLQSLNMCGEARNNRDELRSGRVRRRAPGGRSRRRPSSQRAGRRDVRQTFRPFSDSQKKYQSRVRFLFLTLAIGPLSSPPSRSGKGRVAIVIVTWQRGAMAATMSGLNAASSPSHERDYGRKPGIRSRTGD